MNPRSPDLFFVGRRLITAPVTLHVQSRAGPSSGFRGAGCDVITDPVLCLLAYWIPGQFSLFSGDHDFVSLISRHVRMVSVLFIPV